MSTTIYFRINIVDYIKLIVKIRNIDFFLNFINMSLAFQTANLLSCRVKTGGSAVGLASCISFTFSQLLHS